MTAVEGHSESAPDGAFRAFCEEWAPRVEATLEQLLPPVSTAPERLHEAMRYVMFPGGKRLRPMLALLGAKVTGGDPARALRAAAGLELLHTYSLVHDDLPAMDDDDLRRGRPSCHVAFDEATAILVGDALLSLAFEAAADGGGRAVLELARAAGSRGMVGGQAADLAAEGELSSGGEIELDRVRWIHDHKTGALIRASLVVGALAGGGQVEDLKLLTAFGERIGRAFQIADDCLDLTGTVQKLGKRPGQDLAADKLTYPAVMGLTASRAAAIQLVEEAEQLASEIAAGTSERLESAMELLVAVARFTVSRGS